jgi:TolA-binding protein
MGSVSTIAELRSDPERLLNSSTGQQEIELALLGSLRAIAVPPGAKSMVWNALGVQVIGTGAGAATSSSWASAFWRGTLKVLVTSKAAVAVPVVIAALGAGVLHYRASGPSNVALADSAAAVGKQASAVPAPSPIESAETPDSAIAEAEEPALVETPSHAVVFAPARDHLREESALLERARALLRSGHARAAQATLLRLQAQFPKGSLTQEREVLLIEALAARGDSGAAARDARTFVAAHPESPHTRQLRRFLDRAAEHEAQPN